MLAYALALAAGMATLLSPCILPVLPIVLATTAGRGRATPLWIITGFVLSFAAGGWLIGALSATSGALQGVIRDASIGVLLLAALSCFWPSPFEALVAKLQALRGPRTAAHLRSGALGGLLVGASLGLAWTPCAGPVLASVLALATSAQAPGKATALLGVYALGAGLPMLLIAYGGQWVDSRLSLLQRHTTLFRRGFGALALGVALLQLFQYDVFVSAWATQWLPSFSQGL
jgi:cytochrome c-type biogenesis protein